jgi:putative PIN family toxin of toxin-antitoxin system
LDGAFELIVSPDILQELERTLDEPYYRARRSEEQIDAAIRLIAGQATVTIPTVAVAGVASHPEDDRVLAAAVSANVDYLVTGDRQLQRLGSYGPVRILAPRAFLEILGMSIAGAP